MCKRNIVKKIKIKKTIISHLKKKMTVILNLTYTYDDRYNHNSCYRWVSTIIQDTCYIMWSYIFLVDCLFWYNDACLVVALPFSLQECVLEKTNRTILGKFCFRWRFCWCWKWPFIYLVWCYYEWNLENIYV